jgi:hypothetical protein
MNAPEIPCEHPIVVAVWKCVREVSQQRERVARGLDEDWAMHCLDCDAYDFLPEPTTRIFTFSRKADNYVERDPRKGS